MFKFCPMTTVGFFWLKVTLEVLVVLPMVTLIIPQELISVEQTVMEAGLPVAVPVVLRVIVEPAMFVWIMFGLWLELFSTL